jgi:hypothetical protein
VASGTVQGILKFFIYVRTLRFCYKYVMIRTVVDVRTLSNHVNLCLDFFLFSLFDFILFTIVVYGNNNFPDESEKLTVRHFCHSVLRFKV